MVYVPKVYQGAKEDNIDVTHAYLGSPTLPLTIMDGINNTSVIPVLNHIVWSIMNLYFNCVSSIIDEEYNASLPTSYHC